MTQRYRPNCGSSIQNRIFVFFQHTRCSVTGTCSAIETFTLTLLEKKIMYLEFKDEEWMLGVLEKRIPIRTGYNKGEQLGIYVFTMHEKVHFDPRGQNGRLAYCIFTRAVSESPVWSHVSNHIFLYKFMRTRVGSPFTDIENAP